MKFYAGIGSRETPPEILSIMKCIGKELETQGYILRSGNADGADNAFASGVVKNAQIWLPYADFNKEYKKSRPKHDYRVISREDADAQKSIIEFHPNPSKLSTRGWSYMLRNYRQIVGLNEPDSEFIICWTYEGRERGGTAQAMKIAKSLKIPIYNLFNFTKKQVLSEIRKLNMIS